MLNRAQQPSIKTIQGIDFPKPEIIQLPNGSQLFIINQGEVDVCRLDIIFHAGSKFQNGKLIAQASASLLTEGTSQYSSRELSEYFDFWGSYIGCTADKDFAKVTVFALTKYLEQTLERLQIIIQDPSYPSNELSLWASRGKQNLIVEMEKTSTPARIELFKNLYGQNHPYGTFAQPADYDFVSSEALQNFHSHYFGSTESTIFLSGRISDDHIALVKKYLGETAWGLSKTQSVVIPPAQTSPGGYYIAKPKALQASIRIGREICPRTHPDYTDLSVLNTILGGYFGSRLMMNLREDKGYTYGIGSHIITFLDSTVLAISADVGANYTLQAIEEIWKEIDQLKSEPIPATELLRVRNHLMGEMLRSFNGPFATAESVMGLACYNNLDYSLHDELIHSIQRITPERIMDLAGQWLNKEDMVVAVSGPQNPF